ncbi:hypothetical protein CMK14_07860 [Candidatus Poribacteria bacterium]|nr:hypothetical protein [Candidatus Poribacteria bacterium]
MEEDAYGGISMAAVWDEVFGAFPQVDDGIMDGWMESAYELRKYHGNAVFADRPESTSTLAVARGYDLAKLERGMLHLRKRFQCFSPAQVRYYSTHGALSAINHLRYQ